MIIIKNIELKNHMPGIHLYDFNVLSYLTSQSPLDRIFVLLRYD